MSSFGSDVRFAVRQMRKAPGFALTVLVTLGLGIAAMTVVFSLVDAVLLRPLALPDPDRLISLDTLEPHSRTNGASMARNGTSYPNFFDWRSQNKSFVSMASYTTGGVILGADGSGPARRVPAVQVSGEFFDTVGVAPVLGRGFSRSDERPGTRTAVLSDATWQSMFQGAKDVVGKTIVLSDMTYTVVGVMPKEFAFPVTHADAAVWISMARDAEGKTPMTEQRGYNALAVVGKLRPGVTVAQAKAEMDTIQQGLAVRYPDDDKHETAVSVVPVLQDIVSDVRTPLRILFAAVCCLLLIVCANVAGLLLTRMSQRRGELAVRSALGATRGQILRQLLVESVMLSVGGGVIGLVVAQVLLKVAPRILPANLPRVEQVSLSGEVLAFAVAVSLITGVLFGVLPAWRAAKQDPATALAESGRSGLAGRRQYRLQSVLVVAQTALGLVLLVGAGLLIHSFDRILKVDPGFNPQQMLSFRVSIPGKRYSDEQRSLLFRELLPKLQAMPGVKMATAAFPLPLTEGDINITFSIAGKPTPPGDEPAARVSLPEPGYFETLQIPLKRGRLFLAQEYDAKAVPVAIVNEAFAKRYFSEQDAVGQHMRAGLGEGDPPPMREIVGVVGDVKRGNLTEEAMPEYYIPYEQAPVAIPNVAMRVSGDPNAYAGMVRAELAKIDSSLPVYRFQSYGDDLQRTTAQERFQTMLLSAFAGVALLLAGIGLYAVLSYMVSQRTTELGLRMALGASRGGVLKLMLVQGLRLAVMGLCGGLVVAAVLTRSIAGLLYGVKPLDVATFAGMTLVLLVVSCVASVVPAYRASMLEPMDALRQ